MNREVNAFTEKEDLNRKIVELFEVLFNESDSNMMEALARPEDFKLSIPSFLQRHVQEAFSFYYCTPFPPAVTWYLRGVEMIPSVDLAITLYHKDYVLYKSDWMIRKVPLASPRKFEKEWYTEYVVALQEAFSYFKNDNVESN